MTPAEIDADIARITLEWAALRPFGGFPLVMIDPPWSFTGNSVAKPGRNVRGHYATQPEDWMLRLPMAALLADQAVVWLWATWPNLPLAMRCTEAWGLRYVTGGDWGKITKARTAHMGTGHVLRGCSEPYLILAKGKPRFPDKGIRGLILARRREHSRKPDEAYANAARMVPPEAPKADIFARQARPGWTVWGNQTGKFVEEGHAPIA